MTGVCICSDPLELRGNGTFGIVCMNWMFQQNPRAKFLKLLVSQYMDRI